MANEIARALRKRMTPHEVKLWQQLRYLDGFHFRRQVPLGPYVVDFAEKTHRLVIEVDGSHHNDEPNLVKDAARDLYLKNLGYRVLRVWNFDVDRHMDGVIDAVLAAVK
jgi:very-short-patch-repair endonuclease